MDDLAFINEKDLATLSRPAKSLPKISSKFDIYSPGSVAQLSASQGVMESGLMLPLIMDWLREDVRVLIFTYEKYSVLWNVKLKDYKNKNVKDIALRKVVDEFNVMHPQINVEVVRKRLHTVVL